MLCLLRDGSFGGVGYTSLTSPHRTVGYAKGKEIVLVIVTIVYKN